MGSKSLYFAIVCIIFAMHCDRILSGNIPDGKYSEQSNDAPKKPEFRSRNVLQVWEKAQRVSKLN